MHLQQEMLTAEDLSNTLKVLNQMDPADSRDTTPLSVFAQSLQSLTGPLKLASASRYLVELNMTTITVHY